MSRQEILEHGADETIGAVYEAIKSTLCVTYVPSLFRKLATHATFFPNMWTSLEPTLTIYYVRAADALRADAVERVDSLGDDLSLPEPERERLREALWTVHFVAPKTLLAAAALEAALSTGTTDAASQVVWPQNTGVPRGMPRPDFVHPDDAPEAVSQRYAEIRETLQLPALTDEWRALGSSSDALESVWGQVRELAQGDAYPRAVEELASAAREHGRTLPRRVLDLDPETLRNRGVDDEAQRAVRETVSAFVPALARETIHTSLWLSRLASSEAAEMTGLQLLRRWTVPHGYRTDTVLA
jgi:hypothetical protein